MRILYTLLALSFGILYILKIGRYLIFDIIIKGFTSIRKEPLRARIYDNIEYYSMILLLIVLLIIGIKYLYDFMNFLY